MFNIFRYIFIVSIFTLATITILEYSKNGYVSTYFNIHIINAIIVISGILTILFSSTKNETKKSKK